jgi:hypothetical protein
MTHLKDATAQSAAIAAFSEPAGQLAENGDFSREVLYREAYTRSQGGGDASAVLPILAGVGLLVAIAFASWSGSQPTEQQKIDQLQQQLTLHQAEKAEFCSNSK